MNDYERSRVQQCVDIINAGGIVPERLLREVAYMAERWLAWDERQERSAPALKKPASRRLRYAAEQMRLHFQPGETVETVLLTMLEAEHRHQQKKKPT